MAIVLFDQNDFIELAHAEKQPKRAKPVYCEMLTVVRELKRRGHRFPLSRSRYYETAKMVSTKHRRDVAMMMQELSNYEALLDPMLTIRIEATNELADRFEGIDRWEFPIFGHGFTHAFGTKGWKVEGPHPAPHWMGELAKELISEFDRPLQFAILACEGSEGHPVDRQKMAEAADRQGRTFVEGEQTADEQISEYARSSGDDITRLARCRTLTDFLPEILLVAEHGGIQLDQLIGNLAEPSVSFVQSVPGLDVVSELRAQKWRNRQQLWTSNDWYDVITLQHGIPYCDIVSADKDWADKTNRTGLCQKYETTVVGRPTDLLTHLKDL